MRKLIFTLMILGISASYYAQNERRIDRWNRWDRDPTLAVGIQIADPRGEFDQNYDGVLAGIAGTFSVPMGNSPFEWGIGFAWNSMGADNEDVSVIAGEDIDGDLVYEEGTMRITSNNYRYQMLGRFRPFNGRIQPYGDLIGGLERFTTSSDIKVDNAGHSEVIESNTAHRDFGITFGWAAGMRIRVNQHLFIDARFENLEGGIASYVDKETITINPDNNALEFDMRESRTDKYTFQVGIAVHF